MADDPNSTVDTANPAGLDVKSMSPADWFNLLRKHYDPLTWAMAVIDEFLEIETVTPETVDRRRVERRASASGSSSKNSVAATTESPATQPPAKG